MDLKQLRQFVTIAEEGSFRKAADRLHIAQPALSLSIQKLEQRVGALLFERKARGVTLAAAGMALLGDAQRALFHAEQGRRAVQLAAHGEWGTLRLGFVGLATYEILPEALPRFRREFPQIQLELREGNTLELIEQVNDNKLDAALVRGPLSESAQIEHWPVAMDHLLLAVPSTHPLAKRKRIPLASAANEPFVMYSQRRAPGLRDVVIGQCIRAGFIPQISQEAVQVQTVVSLVASGLGIAIVPAAARHYTNRHVRFVTLTDAEVRSSVSLNLVLHRDTTCAPALRLRDCLLH